MNDPQPGDRLNRRDFVRLGATLAGGTLLAGCVPGAAPPAAPPAKPGAGSAPAAPQGQPAAQSSYVPDRVVKVGMILPLTGNAALAAQLNQAGMRHALKEFEEKGWKFDVLVEDTKYDATAALRATEKLIERDQVSFLLGPIGSHEALAIRDSVNAGRTIMSTSSAVAREITGSRCSRYIFRSTPTSYMYGLGYGPWLAQHLGKTAYVLTADFAAGIEVADAIMDGFKREGGEMVGYAKAPLSTTDFAPYIPPILNSRADFVTGFLTGKNAIDALKSFQQFGVKERMQVAYGVAFTSNDVIEAEGETAEQVYEYVEFSESLETPEYREWARRHLELNPDLRRIAHYNVHGYTAAKSVLLGIERAGSLEPEKISAAMETLSFQAPHGPIQFGPNHQATLNMYVTQVREMKHIVLDSIVNQTDPNVGECQIS